METVIDFCGCHAVKREVGAVVRLTVVVIARVTRLRLRETTILIDIQVPGAVASEVTG